MTPKVTEGRWHHSASLWRLCGAVSVTTYLMTVNSNYLTIISTDEFDSVLYNVTVGDI